MSRILTTLLFTFLILNTQIIQINGLMEDEAQYAPTTMADHYYSQFITTTSYNISNLEEGKAVVFYLKQHNKKVNDKYLKRNPITITLMTDQNKQTCLFKSYSQMCSLPRVLTSFLLKIQCKKTPCQLSWKITQPLFKSGNGEHKMDQLIAVNIGSDRAILMVKCSNYFIQNLYIDNMKLLTNSKYNKYVSVLGTVYYLFDNEYEGYYYLTSDNYEITNCVNALLIHVVQTIDFSQDNNSLIDFIAADNQNIYQFKSIPYYDFKIEFSVHDITNAKLLDTTKILILLTGFQGQQQKNISSINLAVDKQDNSIDFDIVYKSPTENFDRYQLTLYGKGNIMIVHCRFIQTYIQEIDFKKYSYFSLKQGQKIKYKFKPSKSEKLTDVKLFQIQVENQDKFISSLKQCEIIGCQFEIQAIQSGTGSIFIDKSDNRINLLNVKHFENSVTSKIRQGEQLYFSHSLSINNSVKLVINSRNVVVYIASLSKCSILDEKQCYQKQFSYHNPVIYRSSQIDTLILKVIANDLSQFTLSVLDFAEYIELTNSIPFTYLLDYKEKELKFTFNLTNKEDVSFNLIGPSNHLSMVVINKQTQDKILRQDMKFGVDGYVKYNQNQITSNHFIIKVLKRRQFLSNDILMTIIVLTKQARLRLQLGVVYYEKIIPKQTKNFVVDFITNESLFLNVYSQNLNEDTNIEIEASSEQFSGSAKHIMLTLKQQVNCFNLATLSEALCKPEEDTCSLFIQFKNMMEVQSDITITLLSEDSVLQLKDGIWQSYALNLASTTAHFYFIPNNQRRSTFIYYKSTLVDLKIRYKLWKIDNKSVNPYEWPYPQNFTQNQDMIQLAFKPLHYIHIQPSQLKKCQPNCVVLLSIQPDLKAMEYSFMTGNNPKNFSHFQSFQNQDYKIMASNSFIELPQKHKIDLALSKNSNQKILIDLKYYANKQQISFFTYFSLGYLQLQANVYKQSNPRCSVAGTSPDFLFTGLSTSLPMQTIKILLEKHSMKIEESYLCITANASMDTKFSLEFNSDPDSIKLFAIDTSSSTELKGGEKRMYQIQANQELSLKVTRSQGYPYFDKKICKPQEEDIIDCIDQFVKSNERGTQIINKVMTYYSDFCEKCELLVKFTTDQPSKFDIHVQSKYAEVQLVENSALSDYLFAYQQNRYSITGTNNEEIIINIQILNGNLNVQIHNFENVDFKTTNQPQSRNIHFIIPPFLLSKQDKNLGTSYMTNFGLSSFVYLHLIIKSKNPQESASYIITYSSGEAIVFLQDGLIIQYNLKAGNITKFLYINPGDQQIFLYTSTSNVMDLIQLKAKMYAIDNIYDQSSIIQMEPNYPHFNQKTPNPAILFKFPPKKTYIFNISNTADHDILFTICVNNRQIIYLPFGLQYPIQLQPSSYIYIIVLTEMSGYVELTFSKCDYCHPFIAITLDYEQFVNQDFQVEEQITNDLSADFTFKVKSGGIYIKIRSSDAEKSLITVRATFSINKIIPKQSKSGGEGLITYRMVDSTNVEITCETVLCNQNDFECGQLFSYYSISSSIKKNTYAQLVCPSIIFELEGFNNLDSLTFTDITSRVSNNKIIFIHPMQGEIIYLGIKAINEKSGEVVYYNPIEIVTFQGFIDRDLGRYVVVLLVILTIAFGLLTIYFNFKKPNLYTQLNNPIDQRNYV